MSNRFDYIDNITIINYRYHTFLEYYNIKAKYEINGTFSEEVSEERDLDVIIDNDLKCCSQCITLRTDKRMFSVRDESIVIQLCKSLFRPHLQ